MSGEGAPGSWGRRPAAPPARVVRPAWRDEIEPTTWPAPALAHGLGRSYGDSCLNDGGTLVVTTALDRVVHLDRERGIVRAEAGLSLDALLALTMPHGLVPPVCPGTKFVTLGGAVANDVHGKNHHVDGTLGRHVTALGLVRSDQGPLTCAPDERPRLFGATIGGLGLTGVIAWVELRLRRIPSAGVVEERVRLPTLDAFFEVDAASSSWPFTVAWLDLLGADGEGRGVYHRGAWAEAGEGPPLDVPARPTRRVPVTLAARLLRPAAVRSFNALRYRSVRGDRDRRVVHWDPFFFPLDGVHGWNRLYGRGGLVQHQSVVGGDDGGSGGVRALVHALRGSGEPVYLAVLKRFGDLPSPGWLSFPAPGLTLAVDLPFRGRATLDLLDRLDGIVADHGGRSYPAKDGRMSPASFRRYYPDWEELERMRDPALSSSFWRRVTGGGPAP